MQWPEEVVAESVLQHIETYKIDAVVTFDKHGVSRHRNHISLFYAIASLCIEKKVPPCKHHIYRSSISTKFLRVNESKYFVNIAINNHLAEIIALYRKQGFMKYIIKSWFQIVNYTHLNL